MKGPGALRRGLFGPLPAGTAGKVIAYAEAQAGKPYQFSGVLAVRSRSIPVFAQLRRADVSNSGGATGAVQATLDPEQRCVAAAAILYAAAQLGKPYLWGGTGPGDLVFFAGSDGTSQAPGHVGIVIGGGEMIEAYATGFPIRVSTYGLPSSPPGDEVVVGFARPL